MTEALVVEVKGSDLFRRVVTFSRADDKAGRLMRKVWKGTPWMINVYTGSIENHGRYMDIMDWCRETFGPEAWPIHGRSGLWHSGSATVMGWTWMGFATEEMMNEFVQQWGDLPEGVDGEQK